MISFIRLSARGFYFLVGIMLATAAGGAPNNEASPSQDCFAKAAFQHTLDSAQCAAIPFQTRTPCIIQTEQNYAAAVAACAAKGTRQRTVKQNTDAPFTRRLRF
jgi:hypothetical protein